LMPEFVRRVPDGHDRERLVCPDCSYVAYENPKIVVGSVIHDGDSVLLCQRAIDPRRGFWTIPAGYMELGETVAKGAEREAWEEARAKITIEGVLAVFSNESPSEVQVIFRAKWAAPGFGPGPESLEVRKFAWEEIPWDEIAFPSVRWALECWHDGRAEPLSAAILDATEQRPVCPAA